MDSERFNPKDAPFVGVFTMGPRLTENISEKRSYGWVCLVCKEVLQSNDEVIWTGYRKGTYPSAEHSDHWYTHIRCVKDPAKEFAMHLLAGRLIDPSYHTPDLLKKRRRK